MAAMNDQIRAIFRRHGLRCTMQRGVIYRTLAACKSHPPAEVENAEEKLPN